MNKNSLPDVLSLESRLDLATAGCITLVTGSSRQTILRDFEATTEMPNLRAESPVGHRYIAGVVTLPGDSELVVEPNGLQGARLDILRRASRKGVAASVQWQTGGVATVAAARKGSIRFAGDLLLDSDIAGLPTSLKRLLPDDRAAADLVAIGAQIIAKYARVPFSAQELVNIGELYTLAPTQSELSMAPARFRAFAYEAPELCDGLARAPHATLQALAGWCAKQAVIMSGFGEQGRVQSILHTLQGGEPAPSSSRELLAGLTHETAQALAIAEFKDPFRRSDQPASGIRYRLAWQQKTAIDALRDCFEADTAVAAAGAVESAIACAELYAADRDIVDAILYLLVRPVSAWSASEWVPPGPMSDVQLSAALTAEEASVLDLGLAERPWEPDVE